ncbi:transcription repressor OFP1-like [Phragmites australis]|uniref:transcription repressor OFP1-like n=1 Tax=Phragmites australis TaxID=29695 RepID=UPI002D77326C|nr:transcription repressor OFP1-like [Phragmites australis]
MPAPCWFQKLRRRRKNKGKQSPCGNQGSAAADTAEATPSAACADKCPSSQCEPLVAALQLPPEWALSPNRASYYFPSADRERHDTGLRCVARRDDADAYATALDVRVDVVHRRAGDRRLGGLDAPPGTPELKLRPIVTRPVVKNDASDDAAGGVSSVTTSAATTPSTRARGFHVKPAGGRRRRRRRRDHDNDARKEKAAAAAPLLQHGGTRRRRWLYESLVVVKASLDPERELAESMAEMVVANGIRSSEDLEEMLACYLALNAAEHHRAVVAAFRRVWFHLGRQRPHV